MKNVSFVVNGPPEVVGFTVDPDEYFVQVPAPVGKRQIMNASFPNFRCNHRTKPIPPGTHPLIDDVDTAFVEKVFDLPQRQGIAEILH